jgi:hypothetical protein
LKLDRFNANVGSIDTDEKTVCLELCDYDWCDEYRYTTKMETVLVTSILNKAKVHVLTEETEQSSRILSVEPATDEDEDD